MNRVVKVTLLCGVALASYACGGRTGWDDAGIDDSGGSGGLSGGVGGTGATGPSGGFGGTGAIGATGGVAGRGGTGGIGPSGGFGGTAAIGATGGVAGRGGTGGTAGHAAAAGSGGIPCPPGPDCNWCGGEELFDAMGCVIGYVCANGADPCATDPCVSSSECGENAFCDFDGLCWELEIECYDEVCHGSGTTGTTCAFECSDGNSYEFQCRMTEVQYLAQCNCVINDEPVGSCTLEGAAGGPSEWGGPCCGFPD